MLTGRVALAAHRVWRRWPAACVLGLFILLAVLQTWPLATNPAGLSRNNNGDTVLIEWTLAWVAHQTFVDPRHLFEANIFYPSHNTLAFSEHLFVLGMMATPLFWLGASPVLVYNLLLLAGFALTGWSLAIVIQRWTGDWPAGVLAGSIFAFNTHTLTRLPHLHALHFEFLPPMLLVLDVLLRDPRVRRGLMLAVWFLLTALTSNYQMVFALATLGAAVASRPEDWLLLARWRAARDGSGGRDRVSHGGAVLIALAVAGVISAAVMFPFLWPYLVVAREYGHVRTLRDVAMYVAGWNDYLSTAGRLHFALWSERFYHGANVSLFPGVVPLALAIAAMAMGIAFRDARARMCLAVGIAGVLLSFGTAMPGYALLYDAVPILHGIRSVNRFGFLMIFGVAALAGFAMAALRTRFAERRWLTAAVIVAIALVHVEAWRAPIEYEPFDGIPGIYGLIAQEPHALVAEFPFDDPQHTYYSAESMLYSTRSWQPLLNGHSAFIPPSYRNFYPLLMDFPSGRSLDTLRAAGVTHVVVHHERFGPMPDSVDGLTLVARGRHISLYTLAPAH
jgi:hypothetical protein